MIAIPCIKDGLFCARRDGSSLVEGGLGVVSLSCGMAVELLKIDRPPEGPVLLGADDHPVAPSVWGPQGDLFEDSQADISI